MENEKKFCDYQLLMVAQDSLRSEAFQTVVGPVTNRFAVVSRAEPGFIRGYFGAEAGTDGLLRAGQSSCVCMIDVLHRRGKRRRPVHLGGGS